MRYVADFDSAAGLHRALAASLHGEPFDHLGESSRSAAVVRHANLLPRRLRQAIYGWAGWAEAIRPSSLGDVSWEEFGRWVTGHYPRRRFPAAFVGSSNGGAVHLAAAIGAPWLPQTFLVPVRRHGDPDDPETAMRFGEVHGRTLLDADPALRLHHMHDANQDRLMVRHMTYFRVKGRRLSAAYRRLLTEGLLPGAPIVLVECTARWPVTEVGDRHVFQHGAIGGLAPSDYHGDSEHVARYLAEQGSGQRSWDGPTPTGDGPEAEWGFGPALAEDVLDLAGELGRPVVRLAFEHPEDLGLAVADVHRRWYDRIGVPQRRLVMSNFALTDPHRTLRHRAVPLWLSFNVVDSADALERHLDEHDDYDEALGLLFSHGVRSVGVAPIDRWQRLLARARSGRLVGVDPSAYPADFATFARYGPALDRLTDDRPPPPPLDPELAWRLLADVGPQHRVEVEVVAP
jgi:hypothetical protein